MAVTDVLTRNLFTYHAQRFLFPFSPPRQVLG